MHEFLQLFDKDQTNIIEAIFRKDLPNNLTKLLMISDIVNCILSLLKLLDDVETVEHNPNLFHVIFVLFLNRI